MTLAALFLLACGVSAVLGYLIGLRRRRFEDGRVIRRGR